MTALENGGWNPSPAAARHPTQRRNDHGSHGWHGFGVEFLNLPIRVIRDIRGSGRFGSAESSRYSRILNVGSTAHRRRTSTSKLVFVACALCFLFFCAVPTAFASTPLEYTKKTLEAARVIVGSTRPHNDKLKALSDLLKTFLDTDAMAKQALDQHWSKFSAAQQKEFLALFRELFQRTYVQKLLLFENPDFGYVGEERVEGGARVVTKIITPRDEFAVIYQVRPNGEQWLATDIRIEDLSLTMNFRRQLDRLLSKSTPEEVLDRMRKKYGPGGAGGEDDL